MPNFFIDKFRIPPFLLPIYQAAGIEYGVRWEILAAINEIETDYGRNLNVSTAGAVGWMQFMPSTWKRYGVDANHDGRKDPFNPVDAIFAAARYLKAARADQDVRGAVFAYNHADWYVDSVLMRARLIGGLPADLVGSLTGLTQGHFPVHAKARYADDIDDTAIAKKRIKKGQNAALPVTSSSTRRGINVFAKAGSPVIAVQDGKIIKMGRTDRLGKFIQLRDVYGNTYTYAHLKKLSIAYPVPKEKTVSKTQVKKELHLAAPAKDPKPTAPASAGTQVKDKAPAAAPAADAAAQPRPPRSAAPPPRSARSACSPTPAARRLHAGGEEQLLNAGQRHPWLHDLQVLLHRHLRPQAQRRRAQEAQARQQGHRRHHPRAHRAHRAEDGAAHALRGPPRRPRRPAHRSQADPRRLEAARVHGHLPRRRQEPVLGPGLQEPVDRPDPAR